MFGCYAPPTDTMLKIMGLVVQLLALGLALYGAYYAGRINRKNKIADVVVHCMSRYDQIAQQKADIEAKYTGKCGERLEAEKQWFLYHRRYWGLKSDQFDYWLSGLIDCETISSWFNSVLKIFEKDSS